MDTAHTAKPITYSETRDIPREQIVRLYYENNWSSAEKPRRLQNALVNSHGLVSAWAGDDLVGIGNALTDGYLVVYYPHLLVLPEYQGQGIGSEIVKRLMKRYNGFHQHIFVADGKAVTFYERCGFKQAGTTIPMWIYEGNDH